MRTIIVILIALFTYGSFAYLLWWCFVGVFKYQLKQQKKVKRLSDKHIAVTGDIVRMQKKQRV